MSHGGGDDTAEADLTPLLDLVLQLLMFFIINVNFVAEQVSADIRLPASESARPVDKGDPAALFLGQKVKTREYMNTKLTDAERQKFVNVDSLVLVPTLPPMTLFEAKAWLRDKYDSIRKNSPDGNVNTVIYFRPDADLEYAEMVTLMNHCKSAGFKLLKIRAQIRKPGTMPT